MLIIAGSFGEKITINHPLIAFSKKLIQIF